MWDASLLRLLIKEGQPMDINSRLTMWGGHHPLENLSLWPQNQQESDLSHLCDLFYILCGHFDEKKMGTTLPGAMISHQGPVGRGLVATWVNLKPPFCKMILLVWSWNLLCMLEMSFPSFISHKLDKILIFETFLAKFWPLLFYWKSAILRFGHVYDVIVTS